MKTRIGFLVHRSVPAQRLRDAFRLLERMQVGGEVRVASAGLDPAGAGHWVEGFARRGGEIIITCDEPGGQLAALAAAHSLLPVLAAPILGSTPAGTAVPIGAVPAGAAAPSPARRGGAPVAVVPGEHVADAVAYALRILALTDADLRRRLEVDRREEIGRLEEQGRHLQRQIEEWSGAPGAAASPGAASGMTPGMGSRLQDTNPGQASAPAPSAEDDELVRKFAQSLRPRLKTQHGPAEGADREPPLDYSLVLREVISEARELAVRRPDGLVGPIHFLAAIARSPQAAACRALQEASADLVRLRLALEERMGPESVAEAPRMFGFSPAGEAMLAAARSAARQAGRGCLTTADILLAIGSQEDEELESALQAAGVDPDRLHTALLRPETAAAECEELEASRQDRLPKAATPFAVDEEVLQQMQSRIFGRGGREAEAPEARPPAPPPSRPEVIDVASQGEKPAPAAPRIVSVDGLNPGLEAVEEASDTLLDGQVIAMPTDSMTALMADATNPAAVERLLLAARREPGRPVGVLVHSAGLLKNIVRSVPPGVEELLDQLWPGPLTVVFERHASRFQGLGGEGTIGVRLPDHYLTLAVLSTLGRPVAAVAARGEGGEEWTGDARALAARYGAAVSLILDAREAPPRVRPTLLSVAGGEFRILRPGAMPRERIEKALGRPIG